MYQGIILFASLCSFFSPFFAFLPFFVPYALLFCFLKQLRQEGVKLPNGKQMPQLFEFTELELSANPGLLSFLLPTEVGGSGGGDGGGNHKSLVGSTDATAPASAAGAASGASSATTTVEGQEAGLGQA